MYFCILLPLHICLDCENTHQYLHIHQILLTQSFYIHWDKRTYLRKEISNIIQHQVMLYCQGKTRRCFCAVKIIKAHMIQHVLKFYHKKHKTFVSSFRRTTIYSLHKTSNEIFAVISTIVCFCGAFVNIFTMHSVRCNRITIRAHTAITP